MKKDSWTSEYRKKKFYDNQMKRKEKSQIDDIEHPNTLIKKTIAIMLDLDGTIDNIDERKATVFITQLELLRKKFKADICLISISTHYSNARKIEPVLDILSRCLLKNIEIGTCFYYGGTYNYQTKKEEPKETNFNGRKVDTFASYYINNPFTNNLWSAFIDDNLPNDAYKEYKDNHPVLIARPSKEKKDYTNFMDLKTTTKGFDGVIELLDTYIESVKGQNINQIMNKQKMIMTHISSFELVNKIRNKEYQFLEKYFQEGFADDDDYKDTLTFIGFSTSKNTPSENEIQNIQKILDIISKKVEEKNDYSSINKIKLLKNKYNNN